MTTPSHVMRGVHVTITIDANREAVFALVSDHVRFFTVPGLSCRLLREGQGDRNGVGALREITTLGAVFTEEVTEFTPPTGFAYVVRTVVGPMAALAPAHDKGWLELSSIGERTRVDWYSRFVASSSRGDRVRERLSGFGMHAVFKVLLESAKSKIENGSDGSNMPPSPSAS